jgi:hypothetical protein
MYTTGIQPALTFRLGFVNRDESEVIVFTLHPIDWD